MTLVLSGAYWYIANKQGSLCVNPSDNLTEFLLTKKHVSFHKISTEYLCLSEVLFFNNLGLGNGSALNRWSAINKIDYDLFFGQIYALPGQVLS